MKTRVQYPLLGMLVIGVLATSNLSAENWTQGMKTGSPEFKTMGPIAFGPEGILFIADTKSAAITAIATPEKPSPGSDQPLRVEGINLKIAGLLGTSADQILIDDLAIHPVSRNAYLAVSRGRGPDATPALVRVDGNGKLKSVALENVKYSRAELPDAPIDGVVGEGRRRSNPRLESITDIAFFQDRVLVAGLSNEEFASTFRAIPFPFQTVGQGTGVEIYHGAHGRFETRSPVRTFVPFNIGNEPNLLAAYTCTPLVQLPIKSLEPGAKVTGKTVAELGNRNRPLDMIVYEKEGKQYLLLANSSRGIMKINTENIENMDSITTEVHGGGTRGLPYETIESWTGVDQLDQLDPQHAVVVRRTDDGSLNLESKQLP